MPQSSTHSASTFALAPSNTATCTQKSSKEIALHLRVPLLSGLRNHYHSCTADASSLAILAGPAWPPACMHIRSKHGLPATGQLCWRAQCSKFSTVPRRCCRQSDAKSCRCNLAPVTSLDAFIASVRQAPHTHARPTCKQVLHGLRAPVCCSARLQLCL